MLKGEVDHHNMGRKLAHTFPGQRNVENTNEDDADAEYFSADDTIEGADDDEQALKMKFIDEVFDFQQNTWKTIERNMVAEKAREVEMPFEDCTFTFVRTYNGTSDSYTPNYDIYSPYLQEVLSTILGEVQGVSWNLKPVRVRVVHSIISYTY